MLVNWQVLKKHVCLHDSINIQLKTYVLSQAIATQSMDIPSPDQRLFQAAQAKGIAAKRCSSIPGSEKKPGALWWNLWTWKNDWQRDSHGYSFLWSWPIPIRSMDQWMLSLDHIKDCSTNHKLYRRSRGGWIAAPVGSALPRCLHPGWRLGASHTILVDRKPMENGAMCRSL